MKDRILMRLLTMAVLVVTINSMACSQIHEKNQRWLNNMRAAAKVTVVLNNQAGVLPLTGLENMKLVSIDMGFNHHSVFDSLLSKYQPADRLNASTYLVGGSLNGLLDDVKFYNTVVIQLSDASVSDDRVVQFIKELEKRKSVLLALFGSGKSLSRLDDVRSPLIWCPLHTTEGAAFVAQALFGGVPVSNTLKENFSSVYRAGAGSAVQKTRLNYSVPEEAGINVEDLNGIDMIAAEAIREKAAPGAVVMVLKDGHVIYNKAYGSHTYANEVPTRIEDIFDLASVTKISATTLEVMRLYDNGKLNLDSTLKTYLARTRGLDKADVKVREVMLHQAGFVPYIPFYQKLNPADYSRDSSEAYPTKVADHYFMRKNYYSDVMWAQMLNAPLLTRGKYVYSDLSMYYMKEIVENLTGEKLDQYVLQQFYKPLGMKTAGFNPRNRFNKDQIVPTEDDTYFRKTLLQGYVHDQGAAMAGGVSGHAGLFAGSNDLAILYQMLLNRGSYGGVQYFKPETVDMFTAKQSDVSRRGLGFDRWDPDTSKEYPSRLASPQTFGHTGYTGTCVWVDPKYNLVYIFLSNRVHPSVSDKLLKLNIRGRIQDVIYEAINHPAEMARAK